MFPATKTPRVWLIGLLALTLCSAAVAQTFNGRILGSVTDASGAAIAGAAVTITDVQRGISRGLVTDDAGVYNAPNLSPGTYKVRVEGKGFKSVERPNIQVEVAQDVKIDFVLQPGDVQQTVTVTDEVPLLNTTSSTLGGTLSNKEIIELPLNGRNYENLLQLRPGVIRYPGGGFSTTSSNGLRAEDNSYFIEGLFNSEPYSGQAIINGAGIAGDSATILPIDAIQEFNLQQSPPAEYGWKPGSVVNVGLKSGTNALHGSAFFFGRDGALDARNYFNADPNPKLTRTLEQFGGSVGGAIIKDKAFFFGAYEGQRYNVGNSFGGITSPMTIHSTTSAGNCAFGYAGDCANSAADAIADLQLAANNSGFKLSQASLNIAGCSASGSCNGTGFPSNPTQSINITNGFNNNVHVDNFVSKVDFRLNERNSINGMYFFGNNSGTVEDFPELQQKWLSDIHTRAQVVGGSWVWTPNSSWVNEVRGGYNRLYQPTLPGDLNTPASDYGLNTGVSGPNTGGLPRIGFGGYFFPGLGGFKWPKFQGPDSITQFVDHVSYTVGKHALKFGADLHYNRVNNAAYGNARGSITFLGGVLTGTSTPLEDFFAGLPFKSSVEVGNPTIQLHNWAFGMFFQDDWRITKNLTINYGLRYENSSVPQEAHNLLGNFDPNVGLVQVGHQISSLWNPDHKNIGPRLGFAWDIGGNGRTVLRAGGGLIYETVNWQSWVAFNNAFGPGSVPTGAPIDAAGHTSGGTITTGNVTVKNFLNPTPWDTASSPLYGSSTVNCAPVLASGNPGSPCPVMTVDRNLTTPYVWNWNVSLQRSLTANLSLEAAYVGNHGTNLTGIRDINQPAVGSGWPAANIASCTKNLVNGMYDTGNTRNDPNAPCSVAAENGPLINKFPYLANVFQMGNVYESNYNGLQLTLNARNYHGLSGVAGYTYSHASDDVGANWDFGYGSGLPQDATHVTREYANSDFDIRHRLTLSLTYALPGKPGYGQMLEGWEVNSIITLETPQFWGPMDEGTDAAGVGPLPVSPPANTPIRWSFYGNRSDFKSGKGVGIPYFAGNNSPTNPSSNAACNAKALALDGGSPAAAVESLAFFGCYAQGQSIMLPPPLGHFGNMGRNMFQDSGFKNFDFSFAKNFHFGEQYRLQLRAEFFNIFNHPNFANPYGGQNGFGLNDPSVRPFGCGCATPDIAAANPAVGSGGPRSIQLGAKFVF
jgi:Carboxypeptidase regulatory-like domain/TonB dependent receptor